MRVSAYVVEFRFMAQAETINKPAIQAAQRKPKRTHNIKLR